MKEIPVKQYHKMKAVPQDEGALSAAAGRGEALGVAVAKAGPLGEKSRQLVQLSGGRGRDTL